MLNQIETHKNESVSKEDSSLICWICFRNTKRKLVNCHHLKRIKGENVVSLIEFKNAHSVKVSLPQAS